MSVRHGLSIQSGLGISRVMTIPRAPPFQVPVTGMEASPASPISLSKTVVRSSKLSSKGHMLSAVSTLAAKKKFGSTKHASCLLVCL